MNKLHLNLLKVKITLFVFPFRSYVIRYIFVRIENVINEGKKVLHVVWQLKRVLLDTAKRNKFNCLSLYMPLFDLHFIQPQFLTLKNTIVCKKQPSLANIQLSRIDQICDSKYFSGLDNFYPDMQQTQLNSNISIFPKYFSSLNFLNPGQKRQCIVQFSFIKCHFYNSSIHS